MSKTTGFFNSDTNFFATNGGEKVPGLPPGVYEYNQDTQSGQQWFTKVNHNCDEIVDIPSEEFKLVTKNITSFLSKETSDKFAKFGFLKKRNILLHGAPGTGKTVLVKRLTSEAIKNGGIVLLQPNFYYIPSAVKLIRDTNPNQLISIIIEELDSLIDCDIGMETELLRLLDGEKQIENVMTIATTNHIKDIPARVKRPGRFSMVIEIKKPDAKCRQYYLENKFKNNELSSREISNLVEMTEGLTIDEIKETVLCNLCFNLNIEDTVKRIKTLSKENSYEDNDIEPDFKEQFATLINDARMNKPRR